VAMWVLTRNRPTGPRRGTTVLVLGAASVALGAGALAVHFWVAGTDATPVAVLMTRLAVFLVILAWAGLTVATYRAGRRYSARTYGAAAGLTILALATGGSVACMIPGVVASIGALG
jgi:hypothetical protein